jgi:hypothetical protein
MSDVSVVNIPKDQVFDVWPLVEHFITAISVRNPISFDTGDLLQRASKGTLQLWVAWDIAERNALGVMGTETGIGHNNQMLVTILFAAGDEMERWRGQMSEVEDWARSIGASRIKTWARPGWERLLPGFKKTHVMLEKELA